MIGSSGFYWLVVGFLMALIDLVRVVVVLMSNWCPTGFLSILVGFYSLSYEFLLFLGDKLSALP